jgi:hypothetical protein
VATIEELEKLLIAKEREIETLKPYAEEYGKLKALEIQKAKLELGDRWDNGFSILSISELRDLVSTLNGK